MDIRILLLEKASKECYKIIEQDPREIHFIGKNKFELKSSEFPEFVGYDNSLFCRGNDKTKDLKEFYIPRNDLRIVKETLIEYNTILENKIKIGEL